MNNPDSTTQMPTLLVADDEIEIGEIIQAVGEDMGFKVVCVNEGLEVVDMVERLNPDVIALDLRMPGADGVEIIRELGKRKCKANIILMSGMDQRTLSSVQALGREHDLAVDSTLTKPMSIDAIEGALRPFLNSKPKAQPQTSKPAAPLLDYGLAIEYEPEFALKTLKGDNSVRLRVVPKWRKDNGEVLSGNRLNKWFSDENISKGLSNMVLGRALDNLRNWGNQKLNPVLTLKIDSGLLLELDMPDTLAEIADKNSVPREQIAIEIDEATIIHKQNAIVDVLSRLRIKGFKLSICIEGEGEAILPSVDSLPIDQVIIDMEYMARKPNFLQDMEIEFLYSSLTSVTNHKGISACAINVDTADILTFVRRCNFNSARGTQIQSPMRADEVLGLYREGKFSSNSNDGVASSKNS